MAEAHPVAFRFVTQARAKGTTVIHVDPRFSRTSAHADIHASIRPGTDIAFLGGLIRYVLENKAYFHDYVLHYTNAAVLINEQFQDTETLDGLFSGYDADKHEYDNDTWGYAQGNHITDADPDGEGESAASHAGASPYFTSERDDTLKHPRTVFQILRRHYQRYTPEMVSQICGVSPDHFLKIAETLVANSGRERTTAFCYAVGWTQHTTGVQIIRAAGILQMLLGNMGRPGGGIMALRGHASIQGSTDIPTLYNLLPGYINMPDVRISQHHTFEGFLKKETAPTGWWHNLPKYLTSLLKAWYGERATRENDFGYGWLPKINGDHSHLPMTLAMKDGQIKGLFLMGQNPAVGGHNAILVRQALMNLDWLVIRDFFEVESAAFWKDAPEVKNGSVRSEDIKTEVFMMPAAGIPEKEGSLTNTQRLLQWHDKAVDPPGDCTTEPWFLYHLGRRLKELYADSPRAEAEPLQALTWEYPTHGANAEPDIEAVLREINGYTVEDGTQVESYADLQDDGSTACGCWIYSGVFPSDGENRARGRIRGTFPNLGWGFAWPLNRRILYNRASADPQGKPWSERKKYIWWSESEGKWRGLDVPDFNTTKHPAYRPNPDDVGDDALPGDAPFIMKSDGLGWLFVPEGLADGPLPTHYEAIESPATNPLYNQQHNPTAKIWRRKDNPLDDGSGRFPYVLTTYRLTEHHTAGGMTRWNNTLAELQPELFAEISPQLAKEKGIENGGWMTISTPRGKIEAKALVTERMNPLQINGKTVHTVGMPWHWGFAGIATGDIANDLTSIVGDPNVSIHEAKTLVCNIWAGRKRSKR
jgi:formate dehydrogenase major subunit